MIITKDYLAHFCLSRSSSTSVEASEGSPMSMDAMWIFMQEYMRDWSVMGYIEVNW